MRPKFNFCMKEGMLVFLFSHCMEASYDVIAQLWELMQPYFQLLENGSPYPTSPKSKYFYFFTERQLKFELSSSGKLASSFLILNLESWISIATAVSLMDWFWWLVCLFLSSLLNTLNQGVVYEIKFSFEYFFFWTSIRVCLIAIFKNCFDLKTI